MAANRIADLIIKLRADTAQLDRSLRASSGQVDEFASRSKKSLGGLSSTLTGLATGFAALFGTQRIGSFLADATRQSIEFEKTLSRIRGLVGESAENVEKFSSELLTIGPDTGRNINELANALFFVTSAGFSGDEALRVLEQSARAASAGLGDTAVIADAVTSAINTYGETNLSAAKATGVLVAAVREGKTSADQLAPSIGRVLPLAESLGIRFDEVAAGVAALTRGGLSASESITALTGIFRAFAKPSEQTTDALDSIGESIESVKSRIRKDGLIQALSDLRAAFGSNQSGLSSLFRDMNGLVGLLSLTGKNADSVREIFAALAEETGQSLDKSFKDAADTVDFRLNAAFAEFEAASIQLGNTLKGPFADAVEIAAKAMSGLAELFSGFPALDKAFDEQNLARTGTEIIEVRRELDKLLKEEGLPGPGAQTRAIELQQRLIRLRGLERELMQELGLTDEKKKKPFIPENSDVNDDIETPNKTDKSAEARLKKLLQERERAEETLTKVIARETEKRFQLAGQEVEIVKLRKESELAQLDELLKVIPDKEAEIQMARLRVIQNAETEIEKIQDDARKKRIEAEDKVANEAREKFEEQFRGVTQVISQTIGGLLLQQERDWDAFFRSLVASFVTQGVEKVLGQLVDSIGPPKTSGTGSSSSSSGSAGGILGLVGSLAGLFFAKGGIVTRPTLGVLGESGAEAVIPLDRLEKLVSQRGGNVEVNVIGAPPGTTTQRGSDSSGREVIDVMVGGAMARNMGRGFGRQRHAAGTIGG